MSEAYENLEGAAWKMYITTEATRRGVKLSARATEFLGNAHDGDTWRLVTELDKLSFLGKGIIEEKDLAGLDIAISPDFWPQIQRLAHGTMPDRVSVLESLFAANEPAAKVAPVEFAKVNTKLLPELNAVAVVGETVIVPPPSCVSAFTV